MKRADIPRPIRPHGIVRCAVRVLVAAALVWVLAPVAVLAQALRIGMAADVTAIDPHYANIAPNNAVAWHVFDALANVDAELEELPVDARGAPERIRGGHFPYQDRDLGIDGRAAARGRT